MITVSGKVEIPAELTSRFGSGAANTTDDEYYTLDLADCESEIIFVSPRMARQALVEAERLDPFVADQLARNLPMFVPTLILRGERGRLLVAAPTLRRVRKVSLYSGDTHATLMGMVHGLPRAVLAEFENGAAHEAAAEELVSLFDAWNGSLLVLLAAEVRSKDRNAPLDDGQVVAAHEVELERPVLWHLGECPPGEST